MNFVILGAGSVGFQLARYLIEQKENVVLIERDPDKAKHASNVLDCKVLNEEGNNIETLKKAGITKADYFISVTDSDEMNMIACGLVSSECNVPQKIARIRNIDYSNFQVLHHTFLGIDYLVNPEIETARSIIRSIEGGAVSDIVSFEKSSLQMRSITVGSSSFLRNRSLEELKRTIHADFLIAVILRENEYIIPHGFSTLKDNDRLYLIATDEDFERIFSHFGKSRMEINKIVLIGGNRISIHVVEHFFKSHQNELSFFGKFLHYLRPAKKRRINIIDGDYENCKMLSRRFPEAMIFNTDISDEGFSEEEQLSGADLVIAATGNQELNMVNAVYAKSVGAKRAIALVNKSNYVHIASNLGIDVALSPIESMVNSILKYIRRSNVRNVYSISGGKVEVLELSIEETSQVNGKKIIELKLPKQTLIISLTRDDTHIVPDGELVLRGGDNIIVIARKESVTRIEEIFTS
ncbi:MAG: Trk system potassium transporter TrkA [Spirochaetales bacterium]|nr:Trk system potassium transporter TrkA [Spirochaetales bacterium]